MSKNNTFEIVEYTEDFLVFSWEWLNDPEIKRLTMTPDFTKEEQTEWFHKMKGDPTYFIRGVKKDNQPVAAFGIKKIKGKEGEFWQFIGDRSCWGLGLGSLVVDTSIQEAKKLGLDILYMLVSVDNIPSINAHLKKGYKIMSYNNNIYRMDLDINRINGK